MKINSLLITGGAGFIGSHVTERFCQEFPDARIAVLDKMTYSADFDYIAETLKAGHRRLFVGDICDFDLCQRLVRDVDCVVHLAAESHVDNSFGNSLQFTLSNTLGTHTLMEACRIAKVPPRIIHVSTDEVYGEALGKPFVETSILNPTNPYSASKASAEMVVNSYSYSFNLPVIVVRGNNIFGIRQYPEKIIPKFCLQTMLGKKMTLHGAGDNLRHYLAVEDFADALVLLVQKGTIGEIYNIGSEEEYSNRQIAEMICRHFGKDPEKAITHIRNRPFNDARYSIDLSKINRLGWSSTRTLADGLPAVADWYQANKHRFSEVEEL